MCTHSKLICCFCCDDTYYVCVFYRAVLVSTGSLSSAQQLLCLNKWVADTNELNIAGIPLKVCMCLLPTKLMLSTWPPCEYSNSSLNCVTIHSTIILINGFPLSLQQNDISWSNRYEISNFLYVKATGNMAISYAMLYLKCTGNLEFLLCRARENSLLIIIFSPYQQ